MTIRMHVHRGLVLIGQTAIFVWLQVATAVLMVIGIAVYGFCLFWMARLTHGSTRIILLISGGIIGWIAYQLLRALLTYTLKAAHLAAMMGILDGHAAARQNPLTYGMQTVRTHMPSLLVVIGVDWLTRRILRNVQRWTLRYGRWLRLSQFLASFRAILYGFLAFTVGFVDELVWAYVTRSTRGTVWQRVQESLHYLVGGWPTFMGLAAVLALLHWGTLVAILGVAGLLRFIGQSFGWMVLIPAVGLMLLIRWAVFEPFALAVMVSGLHDVITGERVAPEFVEILHRVPAYRRLAQIAASPPTHAA